MLRVRMWILKEEDKQDSSIHLPETFPAVATCSNHFEVWWMTQRDGKKEESLASYKFWWSPKRMEGQREGRRERGWEEGRESPTSSLLQDWGTLHSLLQTFSLVSLLP